MSFMSISRAEQVAKIKLMGRPGSGCAHPGIFGYFSSLKSTSPKGEISLTKKKIRSKQLKTIPWIVIMYLYDYI